MLRAGPSPEGGAGGLAAGPRQQVHIPGRLVTSPGLAASAALRTNSLSERGRVMALGTMLLLLGVLGTALAPGKSVWAPKRH